MAGEFLTLEEAREYANDYESSDALIEGLIAVAEGYICAACGDAFDRSDPKAQQLGKLLISDLNDKRQMTARAVENVKRDLITDLIQQVRTETIAAAEREEEESEASG